MLLLNDLLVLLLQLFYSPFYRFKGVILLAEARACTRRRARAARSRVTHRLAVVVNECICRCRNVVTPLFLVLSHLKGHAVFGGDLLRHVEAVSDRGRGGDARISKYGIDALRHFCPPILCCEFRQWRTAQMRQVIQLR